MYYISRCIWRAGCCLGLVAKHLLVRDESKFKCICTAEDKEAKIMCASVADRTGSELGRVAQNLCSFFANFLQIYQIIATERGSRNAHIWLT